MVIADRQGVELEVVRIVREVLEKGDVQLDDDFLSIGGDSLTATVVASEIERNCGVRLELDDVFRATSLADLANKVHTS